MKQDQKKYQAQRRRLLSSAQQAARPDAVRYSGNSHLKELEIRSRDEVAKILGITRRRVGQIEAAALAKVCAAYRRIQNAAAGQLKNAI